MEDKEASSQVIIAFHEKYLERGKCSKGPSLGGMFSFTMLSHRETSFFFTLVSVTAGIVRVRRRSVVVRLDLGFRDHRMYVTHVQTETRHILSPFSFLIYSL